MIVKYVKQSKKTSGRAGGGSGSACLRTSDYILGLDAEHAEAVKNGERIEAVGFSCPGRPDVLDIDDAKAWLERESEDYKMQGGTGRAFSHFVISFEDGEHPTASQVEAMMPIFRRHMGMPAEAPLVFGVHNDTKNIHVHIQCSSVIASEKGKLRIRSLNTVDFKRDEKRGGRERFNSVKAAVRAGAEICEVQGWSTKNLAYDISGKKVIKVRSENELHLPSRVKDFEALYNKQHPSHTLALAALPILSSVNSRSEAIEALAKAGISLKIVTTKNGKEGAVLETVLGARVRLSALPKACSLSSIDARSLSSQKENKITSVKINVSNSVKLSESKSTGKAWTPARVKNQAKRIIADASGWDSILRDFQREGWVMARAGKSGALLIAKNDDGTPEIRVKMSDIPGRNSLTAISNRFDGLTLENALEDGKISQELFNSVVTYPQAEKAAEKAAILAVGNAQEIPTDPNAIILPQNALDEEALSGQPSALRKLGEVARDTIRESLEHDKSIVQTIERLAEKGIKIELFEKEGVGLVSLRLSAVGIKGSLALSSLPADCRLKALAAKFNEKYRETPDKRHYNPEAAKAAELVEIDPEDDLIEIIRKNLAKIAAQNAHGTKIFDFSRDTRKLKKVEEKPADESAALDISAPVDLKGAEKDLWKAGELVKHEFKAAIASYNKQVEAGLENPDMWKDLISALEKRGWSLEMTETGAQVRIDKKTTIDLADLELKFVAYCKLFGEPDVKMVKEGLSKEELQELKEQVQFDRFAQFMAIDVGNIFKSGDFDSIMNEIEARGWRIEAVGNSAQVVIDDRLTIPLWRAKIDYEELCEKWGREPNLPISGWREMNQEQQHAEMKKRSLRQIFRAKTWQSVIERLELQGARLELTKDGNGGRVVLPNGSKIKISEFTRSLKVLRQKKAGDLERLIAVRKAAEKTQKTIQQQISKSNKEAASKKPGQTQQPFRMPETDPFRLALARLEEENKTRAEERPLDKPLSKKEVNFIQEQHEAMETMERQHLEQQQQHEANYDPRADHGTD